MPWFPLALVLVVAGEDASLTTAPRFVSLASPTEHSSLSMQCDGEAPYQVLECTFTQVLITGPGPTRSESPSREDRAPANVMRERACAEARADDIPPGIAAPRRAQAELEKGLLRAICACGSEACVEDRTEAWVREEEAGCKISVFESTATLQRTARNKWMANVGPTGICDAVVIMTIEAEDDPPYLLWKYTQVRVMGDRTGVCSGFAPTTRMEFRWDVPRRLRVTCPWIEVE